MVAGALRWFADALYWLMVIIYLFGGVVATFQWTLDRTRQYRYRGPEWLGFVGYWLWVAWAAFFAQLLVPEVLNLWSLVDLYIEWRISNATWRHVKVGAPSA